MSSLLSKPVVMLTVAEASVLLSASATVIPLSTTTGVEVTLLPSVKVVVPPLAVTMGESLTAATLTILVPALLSTLPSFTAKLMVRFAVSGVSELLV